MKDIDFDELDKAVSSLMGSVTGMPEPSKQDDTKTLTINETLKDGKAPVLPVGEVKIEDDTTAVVVTSSSKPEPEAPKPAAATSAREVAIPTLAARRSGRFMDMVHPASAMKPAEARSVSRQGVTLAPLEATPVVDEPTVPEVTPTQEVESEQVEAIVTAVHESEAEKVNVTIESSPWPDPIDLHEAVAGDTGTDAPAAPESDEPALTAPLTSPFLTDAKVEKRPLGAPAASQPEPATPLAFDTEPTTEPAPIATADETGEAVTVSQPEPMLPEELRGDLMAIEADQSIGESAISSSQPTPISHAPVSSRPEAPVSMAAAAAAAVGGSIPQQYQEQPSSGDQATGSIYDTASYHQPLEHPAKKQASWLWVVWVAGLLALGAGGGALVYHLLLK